MRYDNSSVQVLSNPIVLYDGVCGVCNRLVQFILRHDREDLFRFAALQSAFALKILQQHALRADLNTVYVVLNYQQPDEQLLSRSDAILFILEKLRRQWVFGARLLHLLPRRLRDAAYTLVARNRYRVWGKYDACPLPDPKHRHKFLDD